MSANQGEFSFRSRDEALRRFQSEVFDVLVIGGGITGAATARDAASRGLRVALVEKDDFACGTSSRSSKLIHGGLRYLENFEFALVFESLSERAFLLQTVPHMVRPLPFYMPVYSGDKHSKAILNTGLWLYDALSLFRSPGLHQSISKDGILKELPILKEEGLKGALRYFDASMWDDVLTVATLRSAHQLGAACANYVEAVGPQWSGERIVGFRVRDREKPLGQGEIDIRAEQVIVCAGPWTDRIGATLTPQWKPWLAPSKGVHLVFDLKRLPVPGAVVMMNHEDGRISFVMPRPDMGAGVAIVGTTDGPSPADPGKVDIDQTDIDYLMGLLGKYFPSLQLKTSDILSAYVGVRPLMGPVGDAVEAGPLQKVSREHHIDEGPGGTVVVAGGKYTTHRTMAEEVVDFALKLRRRAAARAKATPLPKGLQGSRTKMPLNVRATPDAIEACKQEAASKNVPLPEGLLSRYGAEAMDVLSIASQHGDKVQDPEGFPYLAAQLRFAIRSEMALRLEDFYLRRMPLYLGRADHGLPWAEQLARIWAEERGGTAADAAAEVSRLKAELEARSAWTARVH